MVTYYCPNCWNEISEQDEVCPKCGYVLEDDARLNMEERLLMTLRHPVPDIQMMAVQILGELGSIQALPHFEKILSNPESDTYLLREVITALSRIQHPQSTELLRKAMDHPSRLIRRFAQVKLNKIEPDQ